MPSFVVKSSYGANRIVSSKRTNLEDRYRLGEVLGKGGMGVVYKAYDTLMKRDVALKTILDLENLTTLDLFYKECGTLAGMVHPNVISIYDMGEFEHEGVSKPFFVMPLLPGATLEQLIKENSPRLTVEGVTDLIGQSARGLHAAHDMGLVHRDIKPSNIFVLTDGSVKIIDFGIARQAAGSSQTTLKGTLPYMPPEQIQLKPATPQGDQYSLAVVAYEALARRRPFRGTTESELVESILHSSPPSISDLNANVKFVMSQVVHKALAKQPWHRFYTVKDFGEAMLKACRGEPLEFFDNSKIKPRLERATASFNSGDYEFASEVLTELEAEGYLDHGITLLRRRVDQSSRQRRVKQLLESAGRYSEAGEYPLALRKIQEGLELDPDNTDALSLKSRIERERREKKIDEWIQLARQHLDNQAFPPAREALENVLKIKPNDTAALSLMADVDRAEQDFAKTRQKKSSLYESAVHAWERGEVTAALSKLDVLLHMERESPESDSERSHTYQLFYNQVRSEHDDLKNAYEHARRDLSSDNFESALEICRQCLKKYPNHALFQALHFDVEERRRQKLSALIADTDRRVDEEPDLDRRFSILEQAATAYPDEKHFQTALKLVRDKRDLVNSIVNKARYFEESGQFNEALDQWQIVRSIHAGYPALGFEMERLQNRRDQQAHQTARTRAIEEIEKYLDAGNYDKALNVIQVAMGEFPGDRELPELEELVLKNRENSARALTLLGQAKELTEAEKQEDSLPLLREARQLDPRNTVIRTVLVNSLLAVAVQKKDAQDWDGADVLIRELLELKPNHAPALSLQNQIADQKREELVTRCLAQARRLQRQDDYEAALALVQQGLNADPKDPRLEQLRATLVQRQAEAVPNNNRTTSAPPPATAAHIETPLALGTAAGAGVETSLLSGDLLTDSDKTVLFPSGPKKLDGNGSIAPPLPPPVTPPTTGPAKSGGPQPQDRRSWWLAIGGAAAVIILLVISLLIGRPSKKTKLPPNITEIVSSSAPTLIKVNVRANQTDAEIWIDGQLCGKGHCDQQPLQPGTRQFEARLLGYGNTTKSIEIKPGVPSVELSLTPQLPQLVIDTNLDNPTIQIDEGAPANILEGELQLNNLSEGKHTLHFSGERYSAKFTLTATPAKLPDIEPIGKQPIWISVAAALGSEAKIFSNMTGAQVAVDGKDSGRIDKPEIDQKDLTAGPHEVTLTSSSGSVRRLRINSGPLPFVVADFSIEKNAGTIQIDAGEDDATIYIGGKKMGRPTAKGGHYYSSALTPGAYKIRVEKEGFQTSPEQNVEVKAGQRTSVSFQLAKKITTGSLMVRATQGSADVFLDGSKLGTTSADGILLSNDISPGHHSIQIRKIGFSPFIRDLEFTVGNVTTLDAAMTSATGTLKIEITPPGLNPRVTIRHENEDTKPVADTTLTLPEGRYTVTASANGYVDATQTVRVIGGQVNPAPLILRTVPPKTTDKPKIGIAMADWEKAGGWQVDGQHLSRRGGGIVLAPSPGGPGHYAFTIRLLKGKRLEWFVNYVDDRNHVQFQLEEDRLNTTYVVDGAKKPAPKMSIHFDKNEPVMVSMDVADTYVSISIGQGSTKSATITTARASGKFAFRTQGKDEIELLEFRFVPH